MIFKKPKVSVIVTAHNYGRYLDKCLESLLRQTYKSFEIIVVDDGSTDNTPEIIKHFIQKFGSRMKAIRLDNKGLSAACNKGISLAKGKYIVRLDADDLFDENLLLIEANFLEQNPDADLVYSDYYTIDEDGKIIEHHRLMKVNEEVDLLHRSPLAAGAIYKKKCWKQIGKYNENLKIGEDFDFWIKFITRYKVRNINLPLFYYRQHGSNMTKNVRGILNSRRFVKESFVKKHLHKKLSSLKILAIIPAKADQINGVKIPLTKLNGNYLLKYSIDAANKVGLFSRIVVSTEDNDIAKLGAKLGAFVIKRPISLSAKSIHVDESVRHVVDYLQKNYNDVYDLIVVLHVISPLKSPENIREGIYTQIIFNTDTVISACQDFHFHWKPGKIGLEPLFEKRLLRDEKNALLEENGAFYITTSKCLNTYGIIGKSVSYVEMMPHESIRVYNEYDLWLAEQIIKNYKGDKTA